MGVGRKTYFSMSFFTQDTFQFLRDLQSNNSKEWMDTQRDRYHLHRDKVIDFAGAVYEAFASVEAMPVVEPKKSVARINNNRKFHPDKPPYKNSFAVMVSRGKEKCGFYIHIEPAASFIGGGIYHPGREKLEALRAHIDRAGAELERIINAKRFKEVYKKPEGDELKTAPRDYSVDHPYIHFLRKKDMIVKKEYHNQDFLQEGILQQLTEDYKAAVPFLNFIDEAFAKASPG